MAKRSQSVSAKRRRSSPTKRRRSSPAKPRPTTQSTANPVRKNGKATVKRLLEVGRKELEQSGALGFNVDRVLRRTKISPSSLYHHFGNRDGLLAALEFERLHSDTMREIDMLRTYVLSTDDPDALTKAAEFALTLAGEPRGKERRQHRFETLAAAGRNLALRRMLAEAQREGTAKYVEILRLAMEKRGETPRYPIEGIAYLVQSILLGRMLVDLMDDDELGKAWKTTALGAIRAIHLPS